MLIATNRNPIYNNAINPVYNHSINPIYNHTINPIYNHSINPIYNHSINPIYNHSINPIYNHSVNPIYNHSINPVYNHSINPVYNHLINPIYNQSIPGLYIFNRKNQLIEFTVLASENYILIYDIQSKTQIKYGIKNLKEGYVIFDLNRKVVEQYVKDSNGGFIVFEGNTNWIGNAN
ncbi:hypothetical protein [Chryseobacterium sp. KMC2]|uniref:hypothetical protein n=1 Tax=Chryseobacterium sp. KMC2 TaxID=2800705 RepID=UPI0019238B1D|nr:hypothetical protein [Chryseobacterium sp. KMC2]MBL3549338.1 hypothetical protein [Chryseobacterium sp. KMC2]